MQQLQCGLQQILLLLLLFLLQQQEALLQLLQIWLFTTLGKKVLGSLVLLFVVGLVYAIYRQEFCIWTLLFSAVCLRLYPECSAKSFPMCWLEKDVAYTVLGLFAVFFMCRNLSSSLILIICVCSVCFLQLERC